MIKETEHDYENLTAEDFQFASDTNKDNEDVQGASLGFWQDARNKFFKNKAAKYSLMFFIVLLIFAFTAPFIGTYHNKVNDYQGNPDPNWIGDYQELEYANLSPRIPVITPIIDFLTFSKGETKEEYAEAGAEDIYFYFGTDSQGRDLYVRVMVGALISIGFGFAAALIDIFVGVTLGGVSGYYGGKIDMYLQRLVEVLGSIPTIIWVMIFVVYFSDEGSAGILPILLGITISGWIPMYRIVRSQVFKLKEQEFVLSSRTLGSGPRRLIFKHILPNTIGIILIWLMFTIPSAIFFESFLSFIGLGISSPIPSLGSLASEGRTSITTYPYILLIPSMVLSFIMLSFNLIADGLRDAFDPKMRGGE